MKRVLAAATLALVPVLAAAPAGAATKERDVDAKAAFVQAHAADVAALPPAPLPAQRRSGGATFNQDGLTDYCATQQFNDPFDGLVVDVMPYSLSYDCIDETWSLFLDTTQGYDAAQLELVIASLDTDLNENTGDVDGTDYSVLVLPVNGLLSSVVLRTPTPDEATWFLTGAAYYAQLTPTSTWLNWRHANVGSPATFDWYGALSTTRDPLDLDEFPDTTFNTTTTPADPPANPPALGPSKFVAVNPFRLIDTRSGIGGPAKRPWANSTLKRTVTGTNGIPMNVLAVALNVTAIGPDGNGYATVYPSGATVPPTSNLNYSTYQVIPNFVVTPVGEQGKISITTTQGMHVLADVLGYFVPAATSTDGRYVALNPQRVLDTRNGTGAPAAKVGANGVVNLTLSGRGGVPGTGVSSVVLNVTATQTDGAGFVSVYPGPANTPVPLASNLNIERPYQTIPNLVTVPLGADGTVNLYTFSGTHLIADVAGYFTDATAPNSPTGLFVPRVPTRLVDSRLGVGVPAPGPYAPNATVSVVAGDQAGPVGTGALLVNATSVGAPVPGYVTLYPSEPRPEVSNLNVERAYQVIPNAAVVTLDSSRSFLTYLNSGGHFLIDVFGSFQP